MAQAHNTHHHTTGWVGWVYFAGLMMMLAGIFQAIAGFVALFKDNVFVVSSSSLLVFNFTQWGWIHIILGILLFLASFSVFAGGAFGRVVGSMLAGLSAIANFGFFTAFPLWTIILITVDVLVIYALLVHGGEVREEE
ncbi:MAG TPA: hypothetical protein VL737_02110 [Candidatus Pristimantibacillus sp.]|nr:hypothetical protein [Candidatus Pristimantibacillus sp.]